MPTYRFKNKTTGEEFEKFMSWNDKLQYLKDNPDIESMIGTPQIVSGVGSGIKVDNGFREVLSKVKETYKINSIKDY